MVILFLLFVVAPIVELYGIIQVATVIGGWNAIGLLLLFSVLGTWLVKREGIGVLRRMQAAVEAGKMPHNELVDGFLLLLAGALLIAPGFISDAIGLALLVPPIRFAMRTLILRSMQRRGWAVRVIGGGGGPMFGRVGFGGGVYDVTSTEHLREGFDDDEPGSASPPELGR
jgi:UPF0716 protein FxsA